MSIPNMFKPWFVYRPVQILRRMARILHPPADPIQVVTLPWGCPIEIDIRETIGRSIWTVGVYDLAVVEVLFRLGDPKRLALDAGANIGAMTGALACRSSEVWAFEPNPEVCPRLICNVARWEGDPRFAKCRVYDLALSDVAGDSGLDCPEGFDNNHGIASLTQASGARWCVKTARLDDLVEDRSIGLMKMDVEGHELSVLHGADATLTAGRIDHIVFEDHVGDKSPVCLFLIDRGYTILGIDWRLSGPRLMPRGQSSHRHYEAPNFLATRTPDLAIERCKRRGWECLTRSNSLRNQ